MTCISVPKVGSTKEQANYRKAVSAILNDVHRDTCLPWVAIADRLDISVGTIYTARDRESDLSGLYLMRIAAVFGGSYLNPLLKMANVQAAPLDGTIEADILPMLPATSPLIVPVTQGNPAHPTDCKSPSRHRANVRRFRSDDLKWIVSR